MSAAIRAIAQQYFYLAEQLVPDYLQRNEYSQVRMRTIKMLGVTYETSDYPPTGYILGLAPLMRAGSTSYDSRRGRIPNP